MPVCILSPPGYDWVTLSPCYVKTDGDVTGWRELFSRLGVRDGLIIRKERRTLTAQELVRLSVVLPQLFRDHTKKLLRIHPVQGHLGSHMLMGSDWVV